MEEDELLNTPSFRYKAKIIPLIRVLDDLFGITFFHFGRVHHRFGKLTMGNSLDFALRYWREYAVYDSTFYHDRVKDQTLIIYDGENTSLSKKEQEMYHVRFHEYNLAPKGIILVRHYPDYTDTFNFSSVKYERDPINLLIQCIPDLNKYCDFFIEEIKDILIDQKNYTVSNYQQHMLVELDEPLLVSASKSIRTGKRTISNNPLTHKFIKQHLEEVTHIDLSKIELACLYWASQGKKAAETADLLHKSPRTIEGHLLDVRLKLNCSKTSAAIIKAEKLGLLNHLSLPTKPYSI